jgi:hypothetical protein
VAPRPGRWEDAGELPEGIDRPRLALLPDGRVFAYGDGVRRHGALRDPETGAWTATAGSKHPHAWHGTSVLADGRVLVTGGTNVAKDHYVLRDVEVFDPATGTWSEATSLPSRRRGHAQWTLPDGKVLVAGGDPGGFAPPIRDLDVFDPAAGTWSPAGKLAVGRYFAAAARLPGDRLLLVSGLGTDGPLATAEVCEAPKPPPNPVARACRNVPIAGEREGATLASLPDGRFLLAGGGRSRTTSGAELAFDPAKGRFEPVPEAGDHRRGHTATVLDDGRVLVVGGETSGAAPSAEVYDGGAGRWTDAAKPARSRRGHEALLLPDRSVLVCGGTDDDERPIRACERWTPR